MTDSHIDSTDTDAPTDTDKNNDVLDYLSVEDYDYELPDSLIARYPLAQRSASKLLYLPARTQINDTRVEDRLFSPGTGLSGGQQQRLCIARSIAVSPEVILMDEPCSALDPIATAKIEGLMAELSENYTIAIVTHSMQQAARVSHRTAYFHMGKLFEVNDTKRVFTNPEHDLTEAYITGRFG